MMNIMTKSMMEKDSTTTSPWKMLSLWPEMFGLMKDMLINNKQDIKNVIENIEARNETVDAVIFTAQFGYLGVEINNHFRSPQIGISHPGWAQHAAKALGNPENPAYQPELQSPFVEPMTFLQRLSNTLLYSIQDYDVLDWLWFPFFLNSEF